MGKPITHERVLTYNRNEKYELDGVELSEGYTLEVLERDAYTKKFEWKETYIPFEKSERNSVVKSIVDVGKKARIRGNV